MNLGGLFVFDLLPFLVRGPVARGLEVDGQRTGTAVSGVGRIDIVLLKQCGIVDSAEEGGRIRRVVGRGWQLWEIRDCRHSILR